MTRAAIYCRVSTEDQEREGTSLDTQREACLKKAEELGHEVPESHIVLETYSGLSLGRPKLDQLRQLVRDKEVDAVIAYTLDRLSRDPVHFIVLQEELEKMGAKLILVTEDVDSSDLGRLITYIKGFAAKLEAEKIKERTSRGRKARIASGKLANGRASNLFGYDYIPGRGDGEGVREVNLKQAEVVRDIFGWFTTEYIPLDRIIYRLRDLRIASPTGNPMWARASIYNMLTNSAYCGLMGKATPAIIDQETFRKAQVRLKRNRQLSARNVKREYLLRGYVYCQYCGRLYQGAHKQYQTKDGIKEYQYYRCSSSFKINANPCPNHSWKAETIEHIVWQEVKSALSNPNVILAGLEVLRAEASKADSYLAELGMIDNRLTDLDKEQGQLLQWAIKGFPELTIMRENEKINRERKELKQRKVEIEAKVESARQAQIDADSVRQAIKMVNANLDDLSFESKRLALETLNVRVIIGVDNLAIDGALPINYGAIASTPSKRKGERIPSMSIDRPAQLEHRVP